MSPDRVIKTYAELPEGAIPVKIIEVIKYVNPEGKMAHYVSWQGAGDVVEELGMLEFAKLTLYENKLDD